MKETVWLCGDCGYEHNSIEIIVATEDVARQWLRESHRAAHREAHRHADWSAQIAREEGWDPAHDHTPSRIARDQHGWSFKVVHDTTYVRPVAVLSTLPPPPQE